MHNSSQLTEVECQKKRHENIRMREFSDLVSTTQCTKYSYWNILQVHSELLYYIGQFHK